MIWPNIHRKKTSGIRFESSFLFILASSFESVEATTSWLAKGELFWRFSSLLCFSTSTSAAELGVSDRSLSVSTILVAEGWGVCRYCTPVRYTRPTSNLQAVVGSHRWVCKAKGKCGKKETQPKQNAVILLFGKDLCRRRSHTKHFLMYIVSVFAVLLAPITSRIGRTTGQELPTGHGMDVRRSLPVTDNVFL